MRIRVGFASKDGRKVDECLLASTTWWIYDIDNTVEMVEERQDLGDCTLGCWMCRDEMLSMLGDCDLLFACGCETKVSAFLLASGKQIIQTHASVSEMVAQVYRMNQQKVSLDYYRKVGNLWQEYKPYARA